MTKELDEKSEWLKIRTKLNQQYEYDENWETRLSYMTDDSNGNFLNLLSL